jgi:hypothetical protein
MVTACPGSAFGQEGHSHVLNGWLDPTFDTTQSLGHRNLQGGAMQGVMNSLNSLDCPCKVIHPSPQSSLDTSTLKMRLLICVVLAGYALNTLGLFIQFVLGWSIECSAHSLLFL